jgi:hypothetical protein
VPDTDENHTCVYPHCDCAVSFPDGYHPSETECPRAVRLSTDSTLSSGWIDNRGGPPPVLLDDYPPEAGPTSDFLDPEIKPLNWRPLPGAVTHSPLPAESAGGVAITNVASDPRALDPTRRIAAIRAKHADPKFAAQHRERSSKIMKALNADPEFQRLKAPFNVKFLNADPEFRKRKSEAMKARFADPAFKADFIERMLDARAKRRGKRRLRPNNNKHKNIHKGE